MMYKQEGNGLFAWAAYRHHRQVHRPVPEWVLGYFDEVSKGMDKLPDTPRQETPCQETPLPPLLAKALKMDWAVIPNFNNCMRDYDLAEACYRRVEHEGYKSSEAARLVAEHYTAPGETVGRETVRKAYKRFHALFARQGTPEKG